MQKTPGPIPKMPVQKINKKVREERYQERLPGRGSVVRPKLPTEAPRYEAKKGGLSREHSMSIALRCGISRW